MNYNIYSVQYDIKNYMAGKFLSCWTNFKNCPQNWRRMYFLFDEPWMLSVSVYYQLYISKLNLWQNINLQAIVWLFQLLLVWALCGIYITFDNLSLELLSIRCIIFKWKMISYFTINLYLENTRWCFYFIFFFIFIDLVKLKQSK